MLRLSDSDYEHFHLWIARLLVHRGQIDFAREVLDNIPDTVRQKHYGLRAIERRLRVLKEVREKGSVFPLSISQKIWWNNPHLNARRYQEDQLLIRWLAGKIEEVDTNNVYLLVAEKPRDALEARYGHLTITAKQFDSWSQDERISDLSAGRFVELAYYEGKDTPIIRVHQDITWEDADLPPLFPDPLRYLRKQRWVR